MTVITATRAIRITLTFAFTFVHIHPPNYTYNTIIRIMKLTFSPANVVHISDNFDNADECNPPMVAYIWPLETKP